MVVSTILYSQSLDSCRIIGFFLRMNCTILHALS